jgi:hypothetical protein
MWELDAYRLLQEIDNIDNNVLDEVVDGIAKVIGGKADLFVCRRIHERVDTVSIIQILHLLVLEKCALDLLIGTERLLDDVAGHQVLHLEADKRRPLAGLDMRELNDGKSLTVYLERYACA